MALDTLTRTLTKADVINMLRGTSPYGAEMQKAINMGIGEYHGGQGDHFEWCETWHDEWEKPTIQELYDLYCDIEIDNQIADSMSLTVESTIEVYSIETNRSKVGALINHIYVGYQLTVSLGIA